MPKVETEQPPPTNAIEASREKRRASKSKRKGLKIDVSKTSSADYLNTPSTAASTPSPTSSIRSNGDLRSPGQRKSPVAKSRVGSDDGATPDFITQTDRYGNATTPRSPNVIEKARVLHPNAPKPHLHVGKDGRLHEDEDVDACAETLLDSLRLMCCCLMPEEGPQAVVKSQVKEEEPVEEISDRPRLLPRLHPDDHGKKCLVLDLDETLVHSSFRAVPGADFVIPVQIEDVVHFVYVAKRPGVDEFLTEMAKHYEIVIYTASLNKYADPLLDLLDPKNVIRTRLFRESCVYYEGNYVKDLSLLDRDLSQAIIVDNSPSSYIFHPENAIDCSSFIDDPSDRELDQIAAFLTGIKNVKDVRGICRQWRDWPDVKIQEQ